MSYSTRNLSKSHGFNQKFSPALAQKAFASPRCPVVCEIFSASAWQSWWISPGDLGICWLFHNSLSLLLNIPKNPILPLLYYYEMTNQMNIYENLGLYFISSFWAAYWWYLVFNMLEGCDYTDCTSLLVIFCQHICDQKRLIATQTKLIRQLFQILPTHTGQPMSSSQLSHIVPPTDQSANGNSHSYRQLPHLLLAFCPLKTPT